MRFYDGFVCSSVRVYLMCVIDVVCSICKILSFENFSNVKFSSMNFFMKMFVIENVDNFL